jgi:hypothetical protein
MEKRTLTFSGVFRLPVRRQRLREKAHYGQMMFD